MIPAFKITWIDPKLGELSARYMQRQAAETKRDLIRSYGLECSEIEPVQLDWTLQEVKGGTDGKQS